MSQLCPSYSRKFKTALAVTLAFISLSAAFPSKIQAAPLSGDAIESIVGRTLLKERGLLARILGRPAMSTSSVDEAWAKLRRAEWASERAELDRKAAQAREALIEARAKRYGGRRSEDLSDLSPEEELFLRKYAEIHLNVSPKWRSPDPAAGEVEFVSESGAGSKSRFLQSARADSEIAMAEEEGSRAPKAFEDEAKGGLEKWADDLRDWSARSRSCMQNRDRDSARKAYFSNFLQQEAISASVTTVGTLARTGIAKWDWRAFSVDLMMSFISTGVSMGLMNDRDTMMVRWLKVFGWGFGRTYVDAYIYQITPWTDTHGVPMEEAVRERKEFNMAWNAKTSWTSPLMFRILNGIECLAELETAGGTNAAAVARLAKLKKTQFAIKMGVSITNSIIYYRARSNAVAGGGGHPPH
jgi:hypothetical protein